MCAVVVLLGRGCGHGSYNIPHLVQTVESSSGGAIELRAKAALGRVEAVTQMVQAHEDDEPEVEGEGEVLEVREDGEVKEVVEEEEGEVKEEA